MIQQHLNLVDSEWLATRLEDPDIVVLDASWYMPADQRDGNAEFLLKHIPGALRFDFDGVVKDDTSSLPHMLPSVETFQTIAQALGISEHTHVVSYDGSGVFAAPRAWWMFKVMGHHRVSVLNGGLPAWESGGRALESGTRAGVANGSFVAQFDPQRIADAADILQSLADDNSHQVLDARGAARFDGVQPEPRAGLRSGHIPGSCNLPFTDLLKEGHLVDNDRIRIAFETAGVQANRPLIASCGSGVTASVLALAAEHAGLGSIAVYDGSWSEWGQESRTDLPVVKRLAD